MRRVRVGRRDVGVSEVLSSYWYFAAERQHVYHARLRGEPGPWTDDAVLSKYRFTNAYRAAGCRHQHRPVGSAVRRRLAEAECR